MTLDDQQAWRNIVEADSTGAAKALLQILEDLDSRLKQIEDELWYKQGYLKRS